MILSNYLGVIRVAVVCCINRLLFKSRLVFFFLNVCFYTAYGQPEVDLQPYSLGVDTICEDGEVTLRAHSFSMSGFTYTYDLQDGTPPIIQSSYAYTFDPTGLGTYDIKVTVEKASIGFSESDTYTVTVVAQNVDFTISKDATSCGGAGTKVSFTNTSDPSNTHFQWEFGDGEVSFDENPVHIYGESGSYTVTLIAHNGTCSSTNSHTVSISQTPTLATGFTETPSCPCNEIAFEAQGTGTSFSWDFGDSQTDIGNTVTHTFDAPGNFEVDLVGIDANGCQQKIKKTIHVCPDDLTGGKWNNNWVISDPANSVNQNPILVNFSSGSGVEQPDIPVTPGNPECISTFSDPETGDLMFYCVGEQVFNKNYQPMPNGDLIYGAGTSTQTGVIFPNSVHQDKYWIVTTHGDTGDGEGYYYHEVDMSLNGGLGDVTIKDQPLFTSSCPLWSNANPTLKVPHECVSGTKRLGCGSAEYWIIIPACVGNYHAYLFDDEGPQTPIVSSFPTIPGLNIQNRVGFSDISKDGTRYALYENGKSDFGVGNTSFYFRVSIFDFDRETGQLSSPQFIDLGNFSAYSIVFSEDASKLYVGTNFGITQYDLHAGDIAGSKSPFIPGAPSSSSYMGLGPDDKIYITNNDLVIDNPNDSYASLSYTTVNFSYKNRSPQSTIHPAPYVPKTELEAGVSVSGCRVTIENNTVAPILPLDLCSYYVDDTLHFAWDYGDGYMNYSPIPPFHEYSIDGNYEIKATVYRDKICQVETDTFLVTVAGCLPKILAAFNTDQTAVCAGDTITFTDASLGAGANATYTWDFGSGATPTTATGIGPHKVVYATSGMPNVYLKVEDGTLKDDTLRILTVNAFPTVSPTNTGSYCEGDQIELTSGASGGIVTWTGPLGYASAGTDVSIPSGLSTMSGYYVAEVEENGCVTEDSTLVQVHDCGSSPIASFLLNQSSICVGDSILFTDNSSVGTNPSYIWDFGVGALPVSVTVIGPHSVVFNSVGNWEVKLTVTDDDGTDDTTMTIQVHANPVLNPTNTGSYCEGDQIELTSGASGGTVTWTGPLGYSHVGTGASITSALPAMSGYYVAEVEENGCVTEDSTVVQINPSLLPTVTIESDTNNVCEGIPINFTVVSMSNEGLTPAYEWMVNDANVGTEPTFGSSSLQDGDIVTLGFSSSETCTSLSTIQSNPITLEIYELLDPKVALSSSLMPACNGDMIEFMATPTQGTSGNPIYNWMVNGIQKNVASASQYADNMLIDGDVVTVIMTTDYICPSVATALDSKVAKIVFPPSPSILEGDQSFCEDEFSNAELNGLASQSGCNLTWRDASGSEVGSGVTLEIKTSGSFVLEEDNGVCAPGTSQPVTVKISESPNVVAGEFQLIDQNEVITLNAEVTNADLVAWTSNGTNVGLVLSDNQSLSPTYMPANDTAIGYLYFDLTAYNGSCSSSDSLLVFVRPDIYIPNAFTPNDDLNHDTWVIGGLKSYPNHVIQVYNRWGNLVYENFGTAQSWDGTRNGKPLPTATYYYIISLGINNNEIDQRRGHVTIVR